MGLLTEKRTERIDLGDGDWITVILSLDTKQAATISDLNDKPGTARLLGLMELIIDEWSLDLPITQENIGHLTPEATAAVMDVFNTRVQGLDPKVSSSPSTGTSRARARGRMKT